jgi:hypothetical protein
MNEVDIKQNEDKERQIKDLVNLLYGVSACIEICSPVIYCGVHKSKEECKECLRANLVRLFKD